MIRWLGEFEKIRIYIVILFEIECKAIIAVLVLCIARALVDLYLIIKRVAFGFCTSAISVPF